MEFVGGSGRFLRYCAQMPPRWAHASRYRLRAAVCLAYLVAAGGPWLPPAAAAPGWEGGESEVDAGQSVERPLAEAAELSVDASADVCAPAAVLPLEARPAAAGASGEAGAGASAAAPTFESCFDPSVLRDALGGPLSPDPTPESAPEAAPEPPPIFSPSAPPPTQVLNPQVGGRVVLHLMRPPRNGQLLVAALYTPQDCNGPLVLLWHHKVTTSFAVRDGWSHALLPISVNTHPGDYPLVVRCGAQQMVFHVPVVAAAYPESRLQVAPKFTSLPPPRVGLEQQAIDFALNHGQPIRLWHHPFVFPTAGGTTSPFGVRRTFNGKLKSRHLGEDFRGQVGDPVWAANDGVVALAANDFFFTGNALFIDHGQDLFTMYFHLSEVRVRTGEKVSRGQRLGAVGGSGRVTGPHMHFGVKLAGTYIDPSDLLTYDPQSPLGPPW
jgi:hypothetical protein